MEHQLYAMRCFRHWGYRSEQKTGNPAPVELSPWLGRETIKTLVSYLVYDVNTGAAGRKQEREECRKGGRESHRGRPPRRWPLSTGLRE